MYYIINSALRVGEELKVEANNSIIPAPTPITGALTNNTKLLGETLQTVLRETTGQNFNCIVNSGILTINTTQNAFLFQWGNAQMGNVADTLGFAKTTPTIYSNTTTGTSAINLNVPITNMDQLVCNIATLNKYTIPISPPNYVAENLCIAVQCRLNIQTGKSWTVSYNSGTNRITIAIAGSNAFKILWNNVSMYNIAQAMGFEWINMTSYAQTVTGTLAPQLNTIITDEDIFDVIVNSSSYYGTTTAYNFMAPNVSAQNFLDDLRVNLEAITNLSWNTSINPSTNRLTIAITTPNRFFRLNCNEPLMSTLATAMGFPAVATVWAASLTGSAAINTSTILNTNAIFYLDVQDTNSYQFNPNSTNATTFINSLQGLLNTNTGRNWSVVVDSGTNLATISILNTNSLAQILFADASMTTIRAALGFPAVDTAYGKSFTGTAPVNYATVIDLTNLFKVNIQAGAYSYLPQTDTTNTLFSELQSRLTQLTGKSWSITLNNDTRRVRIELISPNYEFQLLFANPLMATIANALGFPITNTGYGTLFFGSSPINFSQVVDFNAVFYVNLVQTGIQSFQYPSNRISVATFISQLQGRLNSATALSWTVSVNPVTLKITIQLNTAGYTFQLNTTNSAMTQLANALGFSAITDTTWGSRIEADNPINYSALFNTTDFFYFSTRQTLTYDTTTQYDFPVGSSNYNPVVHLKQVEDGLKLQSGKNWDILYSNVSNKITVNMIEADSTYRILWGNVLCANIAYDWGFNAVSPTAFTNTSSGQNIINFNRNLVYTDKLVYEVKSNAYYKLDNNSFSIGESSYIATDFINQLAYNLYQITGYDWSVSVSTATEKATITVNTPNRLFNMAFGNPVMVNIAKLLGFPAITTGIFTNTITAPNKVDYTVRLTSADQFIFQEKIENYYFAVPYSYVIEQPNYNGSVFLANLETILEAQTGKSWTVSYNSAQRKVTIAINNANCSFRLFFGSEPMKLVAELLGFNPFDSSTYFSTVTSPNTVNLNITLNQDNVFSYEVRDTTNVLYDVSTKSYQWMIDPPFFIPTYFFKYIQNDMNILIPYSTTFTYDTTTQKVTISCPNQFRVFWSDMPDLAKICGFNPTTSTGYSMAITSDNVVNMTLGVQIDDYFIIEFIRSITTYSTSFYNLMGQYYAQLLEQRLYSLVNYPWSVVFNSANSKFTIVLSSLKFLLSWGQATMANVAAIFGFSPVTPTTYVNTTTSDLIMNSLVNLSTNNTIFLSFQTNAPIVSNVLYMEPRFYPNANIFCNVLQYKLCQSFSSYGMTFNCKYDGTNNKISVENSPSNYQFKFYLGSCPNTATLMGLEMSNISPFSPKVVSDKECYFSGQLSRILLDLRQSVSFTKIKLVNINLGFIYNVADGNNQFYFSKNVGGTITNYFIRIQPANYTGTTLATYLQTQMNVVSSAFVVSYDTVTQLMNFSLTDGNTFILDWSKNKILAQMCGFNPYMTTPYLAGLTSDHMADFVYPKVVYLTVENIKYSPKIVNNRFMFYITLGNINYDQEYDVNSQINKMVVSLYDENNNLLALQSNWQATVELL